MASTRTTLLLCLALSLSLIGLVGCGTGSAPDGALSGNVRIDGSSTVFPITEAVAEEFRGDSPYVRVTVGISGSGGGFNRFSRNEIDIANASRPVKDSELQLFENAGIDFIELPIAYDGIAVVVHPANNWCDYLSLSELNLMWRTESQREIMRWNQIRPTWPNQTLYLFGPGVDSGTYDYFTQVVTGREGASRGDFTSSEDDNVLVQGVASNEFALGFFGFAYYEENRSRLRSVPILDDRASDPKEPVRPTVETIAAGTYFPLSRPVFIYVNRTAADRPEVQRFVEFYMENAAELVREVGYIPFREEVYQKVLSRFRSRTTGTLFPSHGSQIGVAVENLLNGDTTTLP